MTISGFFRSTLLASDEALLKAESELPPKAKRPRKKSAAEAIEIPSAVLAPALDEEFSLVQVSAETDDCQTALFDDAGNTSYDNFDKNNSYQNSNDDSEETGEDNASEEKYNAGDENSEDTEDCPPPNKTLVTMTYSLMSQVRQMARLEGVTQEDILIELIAEGVTRRAFQDAQRPVPSHLMTRTGYVPPEAGGNVPQPHLSHHTAMNQQHPQRAPNGQHQQRKFQNNGNYNNNNKNFSQGNGGNFNPQNRFKSQNNRGGQGGFRPSPNGNVNGNVASNVNGNINGNTVGGNSAGGNYSRGFKNRGDWNSAPQAQEGQTSEFSENKGFARRPNQNRR